MVYRKIFSLTMAVMVFFTACSPAVTAFQPSLTVQNTAVPTQKPASATRTNTIIRPTETESSPPTATQPPPTATDSPSPPPSETPTEALTATPIAESRFDGIRVTFITNAGFLITVGDQRVLIDAIYQGYPGGVLRPLLESQPPFDGVDLILATHEHLDHFDPELVLQYLQNNPETLFVSTQNAVNALLALDSSVRSRLTAIELTFGERAQLDIAGINLEAIHISHGVPGLLNLGFVLTLGGVTFFHTGDMDPTSVSVSDLQAYGTPAKQIDIAFVPEFLFSDEEFHAHISDGIQAEYLLPMHRGMQPVSEYESIFPNTHILQQPYESWVMP